MATWTKSDLSTKVLSYLGVKPAGQDASSEDDNLCKDIIDSVYEQLNTFGLVDFSVDAIPEQIQQSLVKYVAVEAGPYFGKIMDEGLKVLAEREMRRQSHGPATHMNVKSRYY